MDSWEFNKIAAAVLAALLVIFGTKEIVAVSTGAHSKDHGKPGYTLPVEVAAASDQGGSATEKKGFDFAEVAALLPTATAAAGESVFKKCSTCHTPNQGGKNGTGPNLWNIVNKEFGKVEGFNYSKALLEKGGKWDYESLANFLHKPKQWMKGTKMAFGGLRSKQDLADVIAYLRSLSDNPAPLPAQ